MTLAGVINPLLGQLSPEVETYPGNDYYKQYNFINSKSLALIRILLQCQTYEDLIASGDPVWLLYQKKISRYFINQH